MAEDRSRKIRVQFRKNRGNRTRQTDLTRHDVNDLADLASDERLSGKGDLTRNRTVIVDDSAAREIENPECMTGRVLWTVGANHSCVQTENGQTYDCSVRRVMRTLERESRNLIAAGDLSLIHI